MNINEFWPDYTRNPPTTIEVLKQWENKWDLKLPELLKSLYQIHNGTIDYIGELDFMHEIESDDFTPNYLKEAIKDLKKYSEIADHLVNDIQNLINDFGDLDLVVPFAGFGSYLYCFDWNKNGRKEEPKVGLFSWSEENDIWYQIEELTFEEYAKKLIKS